jgi:uncharacterized membrane protein
VGSFDASVLAIIFIIVGILSLPNESFFFLAMPPASPLNYLLDTRVVVA